MAKIKQIGNKEELMQLKKDTEEKQKYSTTLSDMMEKELSAWINKHFSTLPNEAKEGIDLLTRVVWSNLNANQHRKKRSTNKHLKSNQTI
jgi:hypothetical protein